MNGNDNEIVPMLKIKETHLMHMLRIMFFVEAHWQFSLSASHIPGKCNHLADHLSRNELDSKINWTSPSWIQQFNQGVATSTTLINLHYINSHNFVHCMILLPHFLC